MLVDHLAPNNWICQFVTVRSRNQQCSIGSKLIVYRDWRQEIGVISRLSQESTVTLESNAKSLVKFFNFLKSIEGVQFAVQFSNKNVTPTWSIWYIMSMSTHLNLPLHHRRACTSVPTKIHGDTQDTGISCIVCSIQRIQRTTALKAEMLTGVQMRNLSMLGCDWNIYFQSQILGCCRCQLQLIFGCVLKMRERARLSRVNCCLLRDIHSSSMMSSWHSITNTRSLITIYTSW